MQESLAGGFHLGKPPFLESPLAGLVFLQSRDEVGASVIINMEDAVLI